MGQGAHEQALCYRPPKEEPQLKCPEKALSMCACLKKTAQ